MPAPKSRLRPERKSFAPVDVAIKLYKTIARVSLKMPKRYTYLILKDVIELAGQTMDYATAANSINPLQTGNPRTRIDYWVKARAYLQALSVRINMFLEIPDTLTYKDEKSGKSKGITVNELEEILDLINQEKALLNSQIQRDIERYNL